MFGDNVSFTCISNITNGPNVGPSGFILDKMHELRLNPEADEIYKNRNITWQYTTREGVQVGHLSILASEENNGTLIGCLSMSKLVSEDILIAVRGKVIIIHKLHNRIFFLKVSYVSRSS